MPDIPLQQARGIFTNTYMDAFKEMIPVPSFLKSFFNVKTYTTKNISIEVQRGTERIAVDVQRGVPGQRNKFSLSTEKQWIPPFFSENFDATQLDRYDRGFNMSEGQSIEVIGYLASDVAEKYNALRDKIERAKEKQCAQVFETGVVTLVNGDNIDFKRKATSMVDLEAAGYWSNTGADIENQLIAGAEFIRQSGKNGSSEFNLVIPGAAWVALKKTDYFKDNANYNQVLLVDINMPQKEAFGPGYHGQITAGAYIINVWTYDEGYESDSSATWARYWPATKGFMTPVGGTRFDLAHAGIPAIMRDKSNAEFSEYIAQVSAEYYLNNYIDNPGKAHIFEIYSAPLPVPITVDMIYTMQVLGAGEQEQG